MSFNQHIGVTNSLLTKARGDDLINEEVIQRWWKVRFPQHSMDRAYYKEWVSRLRAAYRDEGPDGFPWQADNQSIRTWKRVTGRRQVKLNTKPEATIKDDPCWENYEMVGTKIQDGKEVPNCVPKKKKDDEPVEKNFNKYLEFEMKQLITLIKRKDARAEKKALYILKQINNLGK